MSSSAAFDFDSTLIRRGVQATTISELTRFVAAVEQRPLDKLLADLPGFAMLSEAKFNLARAVLRRRLKDLDPADREQLRVLAAEIARQSHFDVAERIRTLF